MKTFIALIALTVSSVSMPAGGLVHFVNSSSTLISVGGATMPARSEQQYNFAVFLAPASTVSTLGVTPAFSDPVFQLVGGYNTNHSSVAGRLTSLISLDVGAVGGYVPGDVVDFVVRGWSSSMGDTWVEALANWNNGSPLVIDWAIGTSTIGNDLVLGGGMYPSSSLFGAAPGSVSGFNLIAVPEPASGVLAGLGAGVLWFFRRRSF